MIYHHSLTFNDILVAQSYSRKHLRIVLDNKLNLEEHLKFISKVNIIIGVIRGFQNVLPRPPPPTIYKSFIRSHLNYGHIIYDKTLNLPHKLEWLQYNTVLALTGTIKKSSIEEIRLEYLRRKHWYMKVIFL